VLVINVRRYWYKVHVILVGLQRNSVFLDGFSENSQQYFTKICTVKAELFHANRQTDGQVDMTKLLVVFSSFSERSKKKNFQLIG